MMEFSSKRYRHPAKIVQGNRLHLLQDGRSNAAGYATGNYHLALYRRKLQPCRLSGSLNNNIKQSEPQGFRAWSSLPVSGGRGSISLQCRTVIVADSPGPPQITTDLMRVQNLRSRRDGASDFQKHPAVHAAIPCLSKTRSEAVAEDSFCLSHRRRSLQRSNDLRRPWLRHVFADGGYDGSRLRNALATLGHWTIGIINYSKKGFKLLPRRWVIERTIVWLNRNRRLANDLEATSKV